MRGCVVDNVFVCACSCDGVLIGTVTGTDPDNDTLRYTLLDADGGPFVMRSDGSLFVDKSAGILDYEYRHVYDLVVELREAQNIGGSLLYATGSSGQRHLSVTVLDVNEAPRFVMVPDHFHIDEHDRVDAVWSSSELMVFDEDIGNNSALDVRVIGRGRTYYDIRESGNSSACVGNVSCVLMPAWDSPDVDFDKGLTLIEVSILVTDPAGLSAILNTTVSIVDINQGERRRAVMCWLIVVGS